MGFLTDVTKDFRQALDIWRGKVIELGDIASRNLPHAHSGDYGRHRKEFSGTPLGRSMASEASIVIDACIQYRINEVKNVAWGIRDMDGNWLFRDGEKTKEGMGIYGGGMDCHPFVDADFWLWDAYGMDFFSRWIEMRLVHGNVYFEKIPFADGTPAALYVLNSQYISPQIIDGVITDYAYQVIGSGEKSGFSLDEIFMDRIPALQSDIMGKSPVDRALTQANIDQLNHQTIRSFLLNDNKPAAILIPGPGERYSIGAMKEILANFHKQGEGPDGGYRTRAVPGNFSLETFATQLPDLKMSEHAQKMICTALKIPPVLIGVSLPEDPLGANTTLQEMRIIALQNVIKPDLKYFEKYVNRKILPWIAPEEYERGERFTWDYNTIDRMIKYSTAAVEQARKDVHGGLMTINEFRELRELPKLPEENGEKLMLPMGGGAMMMVSPDKISDLADGVEDVYFGTSLVNIANAEKLTSEGESARAFAEQTRTNSEIARNGMENPEPEPEPEVDPNENIPTVHGGLMTINEFREIAGLPPLSDGETLMMPQLYQLIDKDDLGLIVDDKEKIEEKEAMAQTLAEGGNSDADAPAEGGASETSNSSSEDSSDDKDGAKAVLASENNLRERITDSEVDEAIDDVEDFEVNPYDPIDKELLLRILRGEA